MDKPKFKVGDDIVWHTGSKYQITSIENNKVKLYSYFYDQILSLDFDLVSVENSARKLTKLERALK